MKEGVREGRVKDGKGKGKGKGLILSNRNSLRD